MWPGTKSALFISGFFCSCCSYAVEFDLKGLAARGIDPAVMDYIESSEAFPAGESLVDVNVNGNFIGSFSLMFNQKGALCLTPSLLQSLHIRVPEKMARGTQPDGQADPCQYTQADAPWLDIKYAPENISVSIVTAEENLDKPTTSLTGTEGGAAALVNYDFFSSMATNRSGNNRYSYLSLGSGINLANWIVRANQQFQNSEEGITSGKMDVYAQRYIPALEKVFQGGDININNSLFEVGSISGIQLMPEEGLNSRADNGAVVSGIANTAQARVEVRQYGMLIYSTLVPAGPFNLPNVPLKNSNADLEVTVVETDGHSQQFIVPASAISRPMVATTSGYSVAVGKITDAWSGTGAPKLMTLSNQWGIASGLGIAAGALISDKYQSLASGITASPFMRTGVTASVLLSRDKRHQRSGAQASLSANYATVNNVSLSAGLSKKSRDFRTLNDASSADGVYDRQNMQASVSVGWTPWKLGTFSLAHSRTTQYDGGPTSSYNMFRWNRTFKSATLSLSATRGNSYRGRKNQQLNINLSIPFGQARINSYYRNVGSSARVGSMLTNNINDDVSYRLSAERDMGNAGSTVQGGLNANMHYTTLGVSASRDSSSNANYTMSANGGAVLHANGVTFSPNAISDTFAIIELNEKRAGVEIATPGGKSWTDWKGRAIASSIPAWRKSHYDINTASLAKNIDVTNGHRESTPARGTVETIRYNILRSNQILFKIVLADGSLLPKGSTLLDEKSKYIASVIDDGLAFLTNAPQNATMYASNAATKQLCKFSYADTEEEDENAIYKNVTVKCL